MSINYSKFTLFSAILAWCGCRSSDASPSARDARLMQSVLTDTTSRGTAEIRSEEEFHRCAYVYDVEERLRECLVMKSGWSPVDAARRIARYKSELKHTADSLSEVAHRIYAEQAAREVAEARAAARYRDSVYLATHQEQLDGEPTGYPSDALPWVVDRRTGAYYRTDCEAAKRLPLSARVFYGYEQDAKADRRWPSRQSGCQ